MGNTACILAFWPIEVNDEHCSIIVQFGFQSLEHQRNFFCHSSSFTDLNFPSYFENEITKYFKCNQSGLSNRRSSSTPILYFTTIVKATHTLESITTSPLIANADFTLQHSHISSHTPTTLWFVGKASNVQLFSHISFPFESGTGHITPLLV